jgi:fructose-specific phosphotransferase system component IIB
MAELHSHRARSLIYVHYIERLTCPIQNDAPEVNSSKVLSVENSAKGVEENLRSGKIRRAFLGLIAGEIDAEDERRATMILYSRSIQTYDRAF